MQQSAGVSGSLSIAASNLIQMPSFIVADIYINSPNAVYFKPRSCHSKEH